MRPDLLGPEIETIPERYLKIIKHEVKKVYGKGDDKTVLLVLEQLNTRSEKR